MLLFFFLILIFFKILRFKDQPQLKKKKKIQIVTKVRVELWAHTKQVSFQFDASKKFIKFKIIFLKKNLAKLRSRSYKLGIDIRENWHVTIIFKIFILFVVKKRKIWEIKLLLIISRILVKFYTFLPIK